MPRQYPTVVAEIMSVLHLHDALVPYDLAVSIDCEHELEAVPMQARASHVWQGRPLDDLRPLEYSSEHESARVRFECPRCGRATTVRVLARQLPQDARHEMEEERRQQRRERDRERRRRKREDAVRSEESMQVPREPTR